jgi:hypothetical protein
MYLNRLARWEWIELEEQQLEVGKSVAVVATIKQSPHIELVIVIHISHLTSLILCCALQSIDRQFLEGTSMPSLVMLVKLVGPVLHSRACGPRRTSTST